MKVTTKDAMTQTEISSLLDQGEIDSVIDGWIQARRKVWDALFGLTTANIPAPWHEFVTWSAGSYKQVVESLLMAQAAGLSYGLQLPGSQIDLGRGYEHCERCLEALALYAS